MVGCQPLPITESMPENHDQQQSQPFVPHEHWVVQPEEPFVESVHMLGTTQGNQLFGQSLFSEGHQNPNSVLHVPTLQPYQHWIDAPQHIVQPSLELDALGGMPIPMHGNELNELGAFELPSCGHHDAHLQNLGPCQLDGPLPNHGDLGFVESMHMLGTTQGNQLFGQSLFSEGHQNPNSVLHVPTLQPYQHC